MAKKNKKAKKKAKKFTLKGGCEYTVQFPTLVELLQHEELDSYCKDEYVALGHQTLTVDHLGKTLTFIANGGMLSMSEDDDNQYSYNYDKNLLRYVKLLSVTENKSLSVPTLDYDVVFRKSGIEVDCQHVSREDAVKLANAILTHFEEVA